MSAGVITAEKVVIPAQRFPYAVIHVTIGIADAALQLAYQGLNIVVRVDYADIHLL